MDYEKLCISVVNIVRLTGNFIRKEALQFDLDKVEYKGLNDMVSYVDKSAEEKLVSNLDKLIPDAGFLTEEKTINRAGKSFMWIIDPLDGTTNFIHGIPTYAVSVALYQDGEAVLGVVYELNRGEMFYAYKGGGAFLNKKMIQVSTNPDLKSSLLATGFPYYEFDQLPQYMELLKEMMQKTHGLRRIGSAATDLIYVACGRFEAYFEFNIQAWDIAAGCFIVQQAGGEVMDFGGGNSFLEKGQVIATNKKVTAELVEAIKRHF